jgi:hypothetical protein
LPALIHFFLENSNNTKVCGGAEIAANCLKAGGNKNGTHPPKPILAQQSWGQSWGLAKRKIMDLGVVMILPQVHLRKPCYDFTFL